MPVDIVIIIIRNYIYTWNVILKYMIEKQKQGDEKYFLQKWGGGAQLASWAQISICCAIKINIFFLRRYLLKYLH